MDSSKTELLSAELIQVWNSETQLISRLLDLEFPSESPGDDDTLVAEMKQIATGLATLAEESKRLSHIWGDRPMSEELHQSLNNKRQSTAQAAEAITEAISFYRKSSQMVFEELAQLNKAASSLKKYANG